MENLFKTFNKNLNLFWVRMIFRFKNDNGGIDLKGRRQLFPLIKLCLENLNFQVYNLYFAK